ncbi:MULTISPECIES: IclR family transcriptional regulator [unclassified Gordonia (in: high G+C Gram-positive bacteria)]|uniref:IclR family transcriptional regulator n=1 Tax=unclassified Gordonia (in: high G+C Gram-positive bacteria) TaxID=2657482 RepID=UPI00071E1A96|nr:MULTISPECIES: IclR family transcriptional regulator [unclassified Gordonia (in: high G+C Gram-positive bacteria)]KSU61271.1 transcriptional regulator [Gordonia sp. SGD-V-85]SCB77451.1 transcriptional regulator, IclR family [Gordonia sp. v-85]
MAGSGVQTVSRALAVLGCFRGGDELGVTDVARAQGLALSTTHRLLTALVDAGFLEKTEEGSRYRLGGALAQYGQIAYRQHRIYLTEPHLERLAATTGASASVAMRYGNEVVLLGTSRWREAEGHALQGILLPLHASALGKALLAFANVGQDELERLPYLDGTDRAVRTADELAKELTLTRERGYGFNDEELAPGHRTIGLPIFPADGGTEVRFALGIRGTTDLMSPERIPFLVDLGRSTARDISVALAQ